MHAAKLKNIFAVGNRTRRFQRILKRYRKSSHQAQDCLNKLKYFKALRTKIIPGYIYHVNLGTTTNDSLKHNELEPREHN